MNEQVIQNRDAFLTELCSGKHKKGTIKSDEITGKPVINSPEENDGCCACALMVTMFFEDGEKPSEYNYRKSLGLTVQGCRYIQQQINDTPLNFNQIADRIEAEVFNKQAA